MLTDEQLQTFATAMRANTDPTVVEAVAIGNATFLAGYYNTLESPAIAAWRTSVSPEETDEATPWAAFSDIAKAGQRDSWLHGFMRFPRDYSRGPVRKWLTDIWGNAVVGSNAESILVTAGQRNITRAEAILGGDIVASTNAVSARKLQWQGSVTIDDVGRALSI
jgi:hypothetical protein